VKLIVDSTACQGHGRCFAVAPEVFQLDDDGHVAVRDDTEVREEAVAAARRGVSACPERALQLTD
jgi:ferredoxin